MLSPRHREGDQGLQDCRDQRPCAYRDRGAGGAVRGDQRARHGNHHRRQRSAPGATASRLTQLVGVYDGWIKPAAHAEAREVRQLVGLLEDFWSRW